MPLLNHFVAPLNVTHPWRGFHSTWAATIARQLNDGVLPPLFHAIPNVDVGGPVEIDVATLREDEAALPAPAAAEPWTAPAAAVDFPAEELVEVQVYYDHGEPRLMAAVELVSPANKDRPATRRAFTVKCASYLNSGVSVAVVDVVTNRNRNLHQELVDLLDLPAPAHWQSPTNLFAAAYHTVSRDNESQLEIWHEPLSLAAPLPKLPLWLGVDIYVPLDLEHSYIATCHDLRIRLAG
jgi:hypothetical protein